jgi:tetrahydromethanopterin S-methyltransferase subunit G
MKKNRYEEYMKELDEIDKRVELLDPENNIENDELRRLLLRLGDMKREVEGEYKQERKEKFKIIRNEDEEN